MTYSEHILTIKLWEWMGIREKWETEVIKDPDPETKKFIDVANLHINELQIAIKKVKENDR